MLRIASCSYEGSLFGWNIPLNESDEDILREVQFEYGFHASHGSLRSIACSKSGKYMATGGMNERISVYSLTDNQEMGELAGHSGAITFLQFFQDSFLISASEDNTMYIWRCYDWENVHILGGHKDIVNAFAIHPTGKIALSVSRDKTLRIWNLVQGRCSLTKNLGSPGEFVAWDPSGSSYLVGTSNSIQVFSTLTNETLVDHKVRSRINHVGFVQTAEDSIHILYICDNQTLNLLTTDGKEVKTLVLATLGLGRLKSFASFFDKVEEKAYVSFITSNGALLVVDGNAMVNQMLSGETLTSEASDLARSTLHIIRPSQVSTSQRPISSSLSATAAQDEVTFASLLIAHYQLPSEPRLVSVSGVIKRQNASNSAEAAAETVVVDAEEDPEDKPVVEASKKSKKDKKRKMDSEEAPAVAPAEVDVKKSKKSVAFVPPPQKNPVEEKAAKSSNAGEGKASKKNKKNRV